MWKNTKRTTAGLALVATCLILLPGQTQATPPGGVVGTPLVRGSFTDDVGVKFKLSFGDETIVADAKDASQVAFQNFTFAPGGTTGWHSHLVPWSSWSRAGPSPTTRGQVLVLAGCTPPARRSSTRETGARTSPTRERGHHGDVRRVLRRAGGGITEDRRGCAGQLRLLTTGASAPRHTVYLSPDGCHRQSSPDVIRVGRSG